MLLIQDKFFADAPLLRKVFEKRFANPLGLNKDRFCWDLWHVPDQYHLLRTPAEAYFPHKVWKSFSLQLGEFGLKRLGCASITAPWLSYYVEGCEQKLHADVPHGPLAFVYSLCPQKISFHGGNTILLRERTLNYWSSFHGAKDREYGSLVKEVSPKFNRLIVFDPRIPHGVSKVEGVSDPLKARLVIHGWFTRPEPYVEGGLRQGVIRQALTDLYGSVNEKLMRQEGVLLDGLLSVRIFVDRRGVVTKVYPFFSTLRGLDGRKPLSFCKEILVLCQQARFPRSSAPSQITLPLLFSQ